MKVQIKWFLLGFLAACSLPLIALAILLVEQRDNTPTFREQILPSGKTIRIISFHLAWGIEHDDRRAADDTLALEYVSSAPDVDEEQMNRETEEAFELVRGVSEQLRFDRVTISVFPTLERRGRYHIYAFTRGSGRVWSHTRSESKVFIND